MTNEEFSIIDTKLAVFRSSLSEMVSDEPCFHVSGTLTQMNVIEQHTGYLHYFKVEGASSSKTYTIYYPSEAVAEIGEVLSNAAFVSVRCTANPHDCGLMALWIYSAEDIIEVREGQFSGD